jgi:hypothetical protein
MNTSIVKGEQEGRARGQTTGVTKGWGEMGKEYGRMEGMR